MEVPEVPDINRASNALEICVFYFPATGPGNQHRQLAAPANATGNRHPAFVFGLGFQGWFRVVLGLVQALSTVSLGLAFFAILFGIRFGFAFGLVLGCFRICSLVYDLFGVGLGLL